MRDWKYDTRTEGAISSALLGLLEEKPLADELKEVEERAQRIKAAYEGGDFNDEEKARIKMALEAHEKNIARLQKMINEAE